MQDKKAKILQKFAENVRNVFPKARIWAFGSYARNTATIESDLDICVVLPSLHPEDRYTVSDIAWEVGFENDLHISTIVATEKDVELGPLSVSPLLDAIRFEGIAV